jgi:hypothetical protein
MVIASIRKAANVSSSACKLECRSSRRAEGSRSSDRACLGPAFTIGGLARAEAKSTNFFVGILNL